MPGLFVYGTLMRGEPYPAMLIRIAGEPGVIRPARVRGRPAACPVLAMVRQPPVLAVPAIRATSEMAGATASEV
jgi:hypothetical protein